MADHYTIDPQAPVPFRHIGGVAHSLWTYDVSWTASEAPAGRIALALPPGTRVQDPAKHPLELSVRGSSLLRSPTGGDLYVTVPAPTPPTTTASISFIAPSGSGGETAMSLWVQDQDTNTWSSVTFAVGARNDPALVHLLEGPPEGVALVPTSPDLANARPSSRRLDKATLVSVQLAPDELFREQGAAMDKVNFLQRLSLATGEVDAAIADLRDGDNFRDTLRSFEGLSISSALPHARDVARVPTSTLMQLGEAVVQSRRTALDASGQAGAVVRGGALAADLPAETTRATATMDFQNAFAALESFRNAFKVSPIGLLNLERLEMTPAGIQRGELIATIPLAPGEKTTVTHKEWSVTSHEFTSIVDDSLENYSETGVTENSELAQATTSQVAHSNQFNVNATLSGGFGPVTATVSTGFGSQDSSSESANESRKHAVATTRKASSRVKQEHKVTVSTTSTVGSSGSFLDKLIMMSVSAGQR